jgi:hypothetical protein
MSAFENFVQVELPKRPYTETNTNQEDVLVRRGPGPRQHVGVPLLDGQVLGKVGGVVQGVSNAALRTYKLTVTVPTTFWDVVHNLGSEEVIVQAFDENKYVIIPDSIQIIDPTNIRLIFGSPQAGVARVVFLD